MDVHILQAHSRAGRGWRWEMGGEESHEYDQMAVSIPEEVSF